MDQGRICVHPSRRPARKSAVADLRIIMPISGKPEIGAGLLRMRRRLVFAIRQRLSAANSETNTDLILRSAPKARVSKDGPRAHMLPSFETLALRARSSG